MDRYRLFLSYFDLSAEFDEFGLALLNSGIAMQWVGLWRRNAACARMYM